MKTNRYLLIAAIITGLSAIVHGIGAEVTTISSLTASTIPSNIQVELRAVWHGATLILLGSAFLMLRAARLLHKSEITTLLIWFYGLWAVIWFVIALLMGAQNLIDAPQWALLLTIAAFTFVGQRRQSAMALRQQD